MKNLVKWDTKDPFWIFSGVALVQNLITLYYHAENNLNYRKYQTIFKKSETYCVINLWHT